MASPGEPEGTFLALQPGQPWIRLPSMPPLEASVCGVVEAIRVVRNLRAWLGLKPLTAAPVVFITGRPELRQCCARPAATSPPPRAASVEVREAAGSGHAAAGERCLAAVKRELQVAAARRGPVDLVPCAGRLEKDIAKAEEGSGAGRRLANPQFRRKAPPSGGQCRATWPRPKARRPLGAGKA